MRNSWLCKHGIPGGEGEVQPQPDGGEGGGGKGLEVHGMRGDTARSVFALRAGCEGCFWLWHWDQEPLGTKGFRPLFQLFGSSFSSSP